MTKKFYLSLLLTASLIVARAQSKTYVPTIIPKDPDASALFKFTDIPVSYYTGTTDVAVPIYTIAAKGMSVPISVNYHTGGVRLKEEASLVGLGWALSTGGSVSRTIMDKDDFGSAGTYFTSSVPQLSGDLSGSQPPQFFPISILGNYFFNLYCNDLINFSTGQADYSAAFSTIGRSSFDMEPDIFSYQFPGHSGKFILTRNRQVILQKQDNIRVQFESTGKSFTITDEKGNVFYFADIAIVHSDALSLPVPSTWNLSKVVTQQNDSILFTYSPAPVDADVKPDISDVAVFNSGGSDGDFRNNGPGTSYGTDLLQRIDFANGEMQFSYDQHRSDLAGGSKLNAIALYSKSAAGLQYLREYDFFYSYFDNSYAGGDTLETKRLRLDSVREGSGTLLQPPYAFTYNSPLLIGGSSLNKHGFSIDHWGFYNGKTNAGLIPPLSVYYNPPGADVGLGDNNPSLISYTNSSLHIGSRDPDGQSMSAFSLAQVRYPTGGKTVFQWEPNDYDVASSSVGPRSFNQPKEVTIQQELFSAKLGDTTGTLNLSSVYPYPPANSDQPNLTILLTFRASDNTALTWCRQRGGATFTFTGPNANLVESINGSNMTVSGNVCTVNLPVVVPPGNRTYTWDANISSNLMDSLQDIRVTFQYDTIQLPGTPVGVNGNYSQTGGGLRVKSITDYQDDNTVAKMRRFEYNYTNVSNGGYYSYGILMAQPSYVRYQTYPTNVGTFNTGLIFEGSSLTPLTNPMTDNIIGYGQVTEYTVNPSTNADIGKTVYTYFNSPDSAIDYGGFDFPGILQMGNNLNGTLLSKMVYSTNGSNYSPVDVSTYTYHTENRIVYFSPKYFATGITGDPSPHEGGQCTVGSGVDETLLCFYPSIKSERVLLDTTTETIYDSKGLGTALVSGKRYYYDNTLHYLPTRVRMDDSKGNKHISFNRYPQDYLASGASQTGNAIIDAMLSKYILAGPIEQGDSLYLSGTSSASVVQAQLNTYKILPNGTIGQDRVYALDIQSPVTNFQPYTVNGNTTTQDSRYTQKISMDRYDGSSNLIQYRASNEGPTAFVWDYTRTYPIAKIINGDSTSIAYTSFEADGLGNWTIGSAVRDAGGMTGAKCYNLSNGSCSRTGLSATSNYVISYWLKAGSSVGVSGGTSLLQGKTVTINVTSWTYYEQKLSGATAVTVSGSGDIDELRLYPSTAQMTTYTYSSLIGMTSQCDVDNKITYYEYDGLGRLSNVRDQDGNIIKTMEYHYHNQ